MGRNRVTVQGAAAKLGVTEQAIRKRVKRGTLTHDKDPDGRVYVYLGSLDEVTDADRDEVPNPNTDALISQMQARIDSLERSLESEREAGRRKDHLLAAALERRELESSEPSDWRGRTDAESTGRGDDAPGDQESGSRGSWWRRLFGK